MGNDRWGRGGEGGGREMKTAYLTRVFWSTAACYQRFLYWKYHKKEWSSTEQASNETLAKKNPRGTFLQIQTDIYVYIYIVVSVSLGQFVGIAFLLNCGRRTLLGSSGSI